jgi:hypothetical protein
LQAGGEEAWDVLVIAVHAVRGMDQGIQIAKLEFEHAADPLLTGYGTDRADDGEGMRHAALMVVGQIENEEPVEVEVVKLHP